MTVDIVFLHDLKVEAIIGAYEWERSIQQLVIIDLDMATDVRRAAATDRLEEALDYKAVAKRVRAFVEGSGFHLVETLAEEIAALVLTEFSVPWVRVRVNKQGAVRGATDVGVIIERTSAAC